MPCSRGRIRKSRENVVFVYAGVFICSRSLLSAPLKPIEHFFSENDLLAVSEAESKLESEIVEHEAQISSELIESRHVVETPAAHEFGAAYSAATEVSDAESESDENELGSVEGQKSVIMHLLGQLRIGMDLTKVVLPTFILEPRSLLEMFADYMAHAHLLLRVADCSTSESRMITLLEWYLTSFHACRKDSLAKKPYNPIIGEHFHCSWNVPRQLLESDSAHVSDNAEPCVVRYLGEQVSHHPPITAFYVSCPEKGLSACASLYTKSKFMGLSIGVNMIGAVHLRLDQFDEEYVFSLPSAYARSILTVPWTELGGDIDILCKASGYSGKVHFHTKPFYGGSLHRVSASVLDAKKKTVCSASGEWNKGFEFNYAKVKELDMFGIVSHCLLQDPDKTKTIDVSDLTTIRKRVRPRDLQDHMESRRLWHNVTSNLKNNDMEAATSHKRSVGNSRLNNHSLRLTLFSRSSKIGNDARRKPGVMQMKAFNQRFVT